MPVLGGSNTHNGARYAPDCAMDLLKVDPRAYAVFRRRAALQSSVVVGLVDVNKRWNGCKRAFPLGKIKMCRGTRSSALKLWRRGQRRCYRLKGRLQPALFMTPFAIRYCLCSCQIE